MKENPVTEEKLKNRNDLKLVLLLALQNRRISGSIPKVVDPFVYNRVRGTERVELQLDYKIFRELFGRTVVGIIKNKNLGFESNRDLANFVASLLKERRLEFKFSKFDSPEKLMVFAVNRLRRDRSLNSRFYVTHLQLFDISKVKFRFLITKYIEEGRLHEEYKGSSKFFEMCRVISYLHKGEYFNKLNIDLRVNPVKTLVEIITPRLIENVKRWKKIHDKYGFIIRPNIKGVNNSPDFTGTNKRLVEQIEKIFMLTPNIRKGSDLQFIQNHKDDKYSIYNLINKWVFKIVELEITSEGKPFRIINLPDIKKDDLLKYLIIRFDEVSIYDVSQLKPMKVEYKDWWEKKTGLSFYALRELMYGNRKIMNGVGEIQKLLS